MFEKCVCITEYFTSRYSDKFFLFSIHGHTVSGYLNWIFFCSLTHKHVFIVCVYIYIYYLYMYIDVCPVWSPLIHLYKILTSDSRAAHVSSLLFQSSPFSFITPFIHPKHRKRRRVSDAIISRSFVIKPSEKNRLDFSLSFLALKNEEFPSLEWRRSVARSFLGARRKNTLHVFKLRIGLGPKVEQFRLVSRERKFINPVRKSRCKEIQE